MTIQVLFNNLPCGRMFMLMLMMSALLRKGTVVMAARPYNVDEAPSCLDHEGFLKPTATITADISIFNLLGKMHAANVKDAFIAPTTTTHGVSRVNLVNPTHNILANKRKCKAAGLICDEFVNMDASSSDAAPPQIVTINDLQRNFFLEPSLFLGSEMSLDRNLGSPFPTRSFLSDAIVETFPPINTDNLGKILEIFGIRDGTPMASFIETTTRLCGNPALPGEERACAVSFEDLMGFVQTQLGNNVEVLSTTGAPTESTPIPPSTSPVKVIGYRKHSLEQGKRVVVCHDLMFGSAMFYCHGVTNTKVIDVSLASTTDQEISSNNVIQATAMCHMDTTLWLSRHPAFAALHIPRGHEACHFLSAGDLVFVQATATDHK